MACSKSWQRVWLVVIALALAASSVQPVRADDEDAAFRHELLRDHVFYRINQVQWVVLDVIAAAGVTTGVAGGNQNVTKLAIPVATSALISGIWWLLPNRLSHERQQNYSQAVTLSLAAATLAAAAFVPRRKESDIWQLGFGAGFALTTSIPYWFQSPFTDAEARRDYELVPVTGRPYYRENWRALQRRYLRNMKIAQGSGYWACAMAAFVGAATVSHDAGSLYFFGGLAAALGTFEFVF